MSSVLRPVRKRKKSRKLGPVDVIRREDYGDLELDAKVELIRSLVPLGLMHVEEMLDDEVTALAGARYARKDASIGGRRHGSNPGTVGLAGQRVPIRVPRIRRVAGGEIPLRSYAALHGEGAVNDRLLTRVLYGISCRNYAAAAEAIPGAIGLSGSTVSRTFIQASAAKLHEFVPVGRPADLSVRTVYRGPGVSSCCALVYMMPAILLTETALHTYAAAAPGHSRGALHGLFVEPEKTVSVL